jgi:hypothetical protein
LKDGKQTQCSIPPFETPRFARLLRVRLGCCNKCHHR